MFNRKKSKGKFRDKLKMWDSILAGIASGSGVIDPNDSLGLTNISVDFNGIHSSSYISRYFVITHFPDWITPRLTDQIRSRCLNPGVKVNFYMKSTPDNINWESDEIKNKVAVLQKFAESDEGSEDTSVFDYRKNRQSILAKRRIINSMDYLNKADLDQRRTLWKISLLIEISGKRGNNGKYLYKMKESIKRLMEFATKEDLGIQEVRANTQDYIKRFSPFSLESIPEVNKRIVDRTVTDDIMATLFNTYKQGRIGETGIIIGTDVSNKSPVMVDFRKNRHEAENWLITATTGGGKSYMVKHMLMWLLAVNIPVTVTDFEGDEYTSLAAYIKAANTDDVVIVSMGAGKAGYCEPLSIPSLTGNNEIDSDLKVNAMEFTQQLFKILITGGNGEQLNKWQLSVLSTAIRNVYDNNGITDNRETWIKSRNCSVSDVYTEIKWLVHKKTFLDETMDNIKHKAAVDILEACKPYFEAGESKYGTFTDPINVEQLYKAKLVIFSFGEKGKTASEIDKVAIQLKQLSVANISNQISNYHKYVMKGLNVKVWEEYQRWGEIQGSSEIIKNIITGGRKRGDINFIITNDLAAILDDDNKNNKTIRDNLTSYVVGKLKDTTVIDEFITKCRLDDLREPLVRIAGATEVSDRRYYKAFCLVLRNGEKAVVSVKLPNELSDSSIYSTSRGTN